MVSVVISASTANYGASGGVDCSVRGLPPNLLEPLIASAVEAIEVIPDGVLLVVILVVLLCAPERRRGKDVGGDAEAFLQRRLRRLREAFLLGVVVEDRRAVLRAVVAELTAVVGRVDVVPEGVEELRVRHLARVVDHLDRLAVPDPAARHLLVRRVRLRPAGVARRRRDHARQLVERPLHAPEAAAGKGGHGARRRRWSGGEEEERERGGEGSHRADSNPASPAAAMTIGSGTRFESVTMASATAAMISPGTSTMAVRAISHVVPASTPTTAVLTPRMKPRSGALAR